MSQTSSKAAWNFPCRPCMKKVAYGQKGVQQSLPQREDQDKYCRMLVMQGMNHTGSEPDWNVCSHQPARIPAVPLKLKKPPVAKWTNCSQRQWKLREISWACTWQTGKSCSRLGRYGRFQAAQLNRCTCNHMSALSSGEIKAAEHQERLINAGLLDHCDKQAKIFDQAMLPAGHTLGLRSPACTCEGSTLVK